MCLFYSWCFDMKYIWFTFLLNLCNYRDVILIKTMKFLCIKYEYFKYKICTNIIHINSDTKILQFSYEPMKIGFCKKMYQLMEGKTKNHQSCLQSTKYKKDIGILIFYFWINLDGCENYFLFVDQFANFT